ncbi:MAG: hypothetical protein ACRELV_11835 [Longimicrobiales bacterium]
MPRLLATSLFILATATPLAGQEATWTAPEWAGHATFLGGNALLAGLSAGILQELRGGSFSDAFARGALGGAVAYVGRRIVVERFDGAGLLGRQVSALGLSVARNAGEGRGSLERLMVPLGPVRVYVDRAAGTVRPKLDLVGVIAMAHIALQNETDFDAWASLSAGAPVFDVPGRALISDDGIVRGAEYTGTIMLSGVPDGGGDTFAHERVHVLQDDFLFLLFGDPIESGLAGLTPWSDRLYDWVDFNVVGPALHRIGAEFVSYGDRPGEVEATFLEDRVGR